MSKNKRSGPRVGKLGDGTHTYIEGPYHIRRMGDDRWYVFTSTNNDTGHDFETLQAARMWCRHKAAEASHVE